MPNFFAKNLKYLRIQQGETQAGLAVHMGKGQTTIGNWETGFSQPNIEELTVLSNFFGVAINHLIISDLSTTQPKAEEITQLQEPAQEYKVALQDAIYQRDAVIAALNGQIEALKMTVAQMQARLAELDKSK